MSAISAAAVSRDCYRWWGVRHTFGKWMRTENGTLKNEGRIVGYQIMQRRVCECCGFEQWHSQSIWVGENS